MKHKITLGIIILTFMLMVIGMFGQKSPVDLRDSTNNTPSVIFIIDCDCSCDTIPKIDTIPM